MKTIPTLALLACLSLPAARAQTAEGFDTSGMAPSALAPATAIAAKKDQATAPAPAAAPAAELKNIPSRYAGSGPELAAYIETYSARLAIHKRQTDVFGRYQDPNFVAQPAKILNSGPIKNPYVKVRETPFPDVVAAIEVNTIDLAKQRFLVGPREFRVGSILNIRLPTGKGVKAQVTRVSSKSITFRNAETGEEAIRKMEMMPAGMIKGTGGITAPGMQATGANAPLEIQIAPPAPLLAQ
ncbi:hypothetical protein [Luteolibacter sp. Populi]|uniref:hypothetical protein n=1 Tax=Luteolibacter sp. Populi TaxID=3230487 RepID=UPI00346524D6